MAVGSGGGGAVAAQLNINVNAGSVNSAASAMNNLTTSSAAAEGAVASLEVSFGSLARLAAELVGAFSLIDSVKWAVGIAAQAEQAEGGIRALTSSAQEAQMVISSMRDLSTIRPFSFIDLEKQAQFMLAMGVNAQKAVPLIQAMSDATSALGGDTDRMQNIGLAISRIFDEGTVQAREMNQLARQGVQSWRILAEGLGTDIPTAMDDVRKRMVPAGQAIDALAVGMKNQFHNLADELSRNMPQQWQIFKDKLDLAGASIGETIIKTFNLDGTLQTVNGHMAQWGQTVTTFVSQHSQLIKSLIVGAGAFAAFQVAIQSVKLALGALDLLLLSNPITALATVIGAASAAIYFYRDAQVQVGTYSATLGSILVTTWNHSSAQILGIAASFAESMGGIFSAIGLNWDNMSKGMEKSISWLTHTIINMQEFMSDIQGQTKPPGYWNQMHAMADTVHTPNGGMFGGLSAEQWMQSIMTDAQARDKRIASMFGPTTQPTDGGKQPIPGITLAQAQNISAVASAFLQIQKMNDEARTQLALVNETSDQQERGAKAVQMIELYRKAEITDQTVLNEKVGQYENILIQLQQAKILQRMASDIGDAFGSAFTDVISGAKSAGDAIRDLANTIEQTLLKQLVAQPIANMFTGLTSSLFSAIPGFGKLINVGAPVTPTVVHAAASANGNIFSNGIVTSPTFFPMRNGGMGLMGEAGPEAVMPLSRDSSGRLGVKGGGHGVTNVYMTVNTPDAGGFRKSRRQIMSGIKQSIPRA